MRSSWVAVLASFASGGVLLATVLFLAPLITVEFTPEYLVVDLGELRRGTRTQVFGFNSADALTGEIRTESGELRAFVWEPERGMKDLGTLGGKRSEVFASNAGGTLVGWSLPADLWAGRATVWTTSGEILDLGTFGGEAASAYGIDSKGRVVGKAEKSKHVFREFLWTLGAELKDLGTLGGTWSVAYWISESGEIYGHSSIGGLRGAGWTGELGRWLTGDSGAGGESHAVVWREEKPIDLNHLIPRDTGWELIEAYAMNNRGNILARGVYEGEARSCYLIPAGENHPLLGNSSVTDDNL